MKTDSAQHPNPPEGSEGGGKGKTGTHLLQVLGRTPGAMESLLAELAQDPEVTPIKQRLSAKQALSIIVGPLPQALEKAMGELAPELMAKFYPRVYENIGRYHSPRQCAAYLANTVVESARLGGRTPTAYRMLLPALELMAARRMPLFFLAPDLMEAIARTDFASDIDWTELHLPYEQGIFVLPKGAFVHPTDGEVSMLIWARYTPGDYPLPALPSSRSGSAGITDHSMVLLALCPETAIWYDSCLNAKNRRLIRLRNLFYRAPGDPMPLAQKTSFMDEDLTEKDAEFLEKIGTLAFGTFLAMNARPELVERGQCLRKVGKADKAREFWSPNVIGARYRLKREVPRIVGRAFEKAVRAGGTHASPRLHWRRGHFRQQPHGEGRRERKTIWLEPMLIGVEESA